MDFAQLTLPYDSFGGLSPFKRAQDRIAKQANKSRRSVDFDVNDKVWLDMRSFFTSRLSKKLDNLTNGPFEVTDNVYSSFKLKLSESIKVHLVFYPGRLRKALNDPTPEQIILKLDPINITSELKYEIKNILAVR
ncbi:hypothetical protein MBM_02094 [Drepanopeziza brunnea f. sp. 'multigermtubi' MB_m1]|uniref:Uncharacterized protein n=1 Tax=Marssonina brunnea f. sp. multigermtubi (strain MB_m1) TaxID=1072389 RepID=K1X517_MARBU|nr:uncharacterized protein MBM_02094 [Drepanopeziza brunnea f. sp. 'multigermtubi' MB_m1]EKD20142.1 hypothetical protein MBM_02094 [Drepanopeziza brunnea f. sp. 'multigermtubi' MB_m1]